MYDDIDDDDADGPALVDVGKPGLEPEPSSEGRKNGWTAEVRDFDVSICSTL
jgi:hypothetical protein